MGDFLRKPCFPGLFVLVLLATAAGYAGSPPQGEKETAKRAEKAQQKKEKQLQKELDTPYKRWLSEDVAYIISSQERSVFVQLETNEEREQFIEQFWQRRNPDPDSIDNMFKEEHYRRIAYANEHYASGVQGWRTDRGRIYIIWGKPDEVESHPTGGNYNRPADEGGGSTVTFPFEDWRYRHLDGIGDDIQLEFVDPTSTGEYRLSRGPEEKDALQHIPNAGLTAAEAAGLSTAGDRVDDPLGGGFITWGVGGSNRLDTFNRLELYTKIRQAPPVKFKDLEAVVSSRLIRDQIKFNFRFDSLRATSDTTLVPVSIQIPNREISFTEKDGVDSANLNIFGRISTLTDRVIQTFEDTLHTDIPAALLKQSLSQSRTYQKLVPLRPGLYKIDIVLKDVTSGNLGVVNTRLAVPNFPDDKLRASTLLLVDDIQHIPAKEVGLGQFVLGDVKARPRVDKIFSQQDLLGSYIQVYNLKFDDNTKTQDTSVKYRVFKAGASEPAMEFNVPQKNLPVHGEEMTLKSLIPLKGLEPGKYRVEIEIADHLANQVITPAEEFTLIPAPAKDNAQK